jgi:predicted DNA-binding transcriptional regulator YafY
MVTTVQSTTSPSVHPAPKSLRPERTPCMVLTLAGDPVPASVDQRTALNDLPLAASVYMRLNEGRTATDTVLNTFDAMRDSNAVVTLYADGNGIEARVIWPERICLTSENHITCHGYCTLRREFRTFRLDRMIGCHPLSTPDDYEPKPVATA